MAGPLERTLYSVGQGARLGLYMGQSWLSERLAKPVKRRRPLPGPYPTKAELQADLAALVRRDWANIAAGHYRLPHDLLASSLQAAAMSLPYFSDFRRVEARRHGRKGRELRDDPALAETQSRGLPKYYLQNFHYQTDGYLSDRSARLYDHQVEVLFTGAADLMRRQLLLPLAEALKGRGRERLHLTDLACGTGRFLAMVKDNHPRLRVTGIDLSTPYLRQAARNLAPWRDVSLVTALAETLPLASDSQDLVSAVFLFHELPPAIRRQVAAEMARVLKPGGQLLFLDSLQLGDHPPYDGLLRAFPVTFHEPYYKSYLMDDLAALFAAEGLEIRSLERIYFSRAMVLTKL